MNAGRPFFLRGYSTHPASLDMQPSPTDDCAMCRGGKLPCATPAACGIAKPENPANLPLFANDPLASKAIGWVLVLALVFVLWLIGSGR